MNSIERAIAETTVVLAVDREGSGTTGTGSFWSADDKILLVTAHHVSAGADAVSFALHQGRADTAHIRSPSVARNEKDPIRLVSLETIPDQGLLGGPHATKFEPIGTP